MKTKITLTIIFVALIKTMSAQKWESYTNIDPTGNGDKSISVSIDNNGNKWFASANGTVWMFDGVNWKKYVNIQDDFTLTRKIAIDKNDNKWICQSENTNAGLWKFDNSKWTLYNSKNGLKDNNVITFAIDKNSNIWAVSYTSWDSCHLSKFNGTNWTTYSAPKSLKGLFIGIAFDSENSLWLINNSNMNLWKFNEKSWVEYKSSIDTRPLSITTDILDNKWIGTQNGVYKYDGLTWKSFLNVENYVMDIFVDLEGNKWFATMGSGIYMYDNTSWINYKSENGLISDDVRSIAIDSSGVFWFGTSEGVSSMDKNENTSISTFNNLDIFKVFPNPSSSFINIQAANNSNLSIYDKNGRCVYERKNIEINSKIDMSSFDNGIYLFKLSNSSENKVFKIIKE